LSDDEIGLIKEEYLKIFYWW